MYKKVKLDDKSNYELSYVTYRLASMVVSYDDGKSCHLSIGREKGHFGWDDIRIDCDDKLRHLYQAKYQQKNFSESPVLRGRKTRGAKAGDEDVKLSELDKTMSSLAAIHSAGEVDDRQFTLLVPIDGLGIKKNLGMGSLVDLIRYCKPQGATSQEFEVRAKSDGPTSRIFDWLTSWCGFSDWEHILRTMKNFSVETTGLIDTIERECEQILAAKFLDGKDARQALSDFVRQNSSDVDFIRPRQALRFLHTRKLETSRPWSLFAGPVGGSQDWHVTGTASLNTTGIESAGEIVSSAWKADGDRSVLYAIAEWPQLGKGCSKLLETIGRIALHSSSQTVFANLQQWRERLMGATGGTMGVEAGYPHHDWVESKSSRDCLDKRTLSGLAQHRQEAEQLHRHMNLQLLSQLNVELSSEIAQIQDTDFLESMATKWSAWKDELQSDPQALTSLFAKCMSPAVEPHVNGLLRAGPVTRHLLKDTLYLLLALAICCGEQDTSWSKFGNRTIAAVSVRYWSKAEASSFRVRRIDEDAIDVVLGERVELVVLSGVEAHPVELRRESLASEHQPATSIADTGFPAMVTNNPSWRKKIKAGDRVWVRQQLQSELDRRSGDKESRINKLVNG